MFYKILVLNVGLQNFCLLYGFYSNLFISLSFLATICQSRLNRDRISSLALINWRCPVEPGMR